jgi:succinate-semialdehyde dehydrogenase/glutarate-semialdehyde dehydrogenase
MQLPLEVGVTSLGATEVTSTHATAERRVVAAAPKGAFIGGAWRDSGSGATLAVEDPSTGETLCEIADATPADAVLALDAADASKDAWAARPPRERAVILRAAYEAMTGRTEDLALLLTLEMGKPVPESRDEVAYAGEYLLWFAEEAIRIDGRYARAPDGSGRVLVMQHPVGPCLVITPWNFPLVMATRAIAPAIAAGCTMVVKPSKLAPLSTFVLAEILAEAGVPPGVLNVVACSRSRPVTEPLMRDPRLRKVTFTGSTDVGRTLIEQSATQVLRLSMELGGNAPFIVFADADLDAAVEGALGAKMRNIGEACTSANRFYVERPVLEEFTARLADRMSALRLGRGADPGAQVGPLIEAAARDRVHGLVLDAVERGANLVTGGELPGGPGYFYPPTVLSEVSDDAACVREEIFGPVAPILAFDDEAEAIARANDTDLGLAAYVYTQDFHRALRVIERLETGMVGLNQGRVSNPMAPFGGIKHSGLGRAGGPEAIAEYLETKYVAIQHD